MPASLRSRLSRASGEEGDGLGGDRVAQPAGAVDVEAVAAGVVEVAQVDELADLFARAAADDRDGRARREAPQRLAHGLRHARRRRLLDDGRQGPVVVQEDDEPPRLSPQVLAPAQRVRERVPTKVATLGARIAGGGVRSFGAAQRGGEADAGGAPVSMA